MTPEEEERVRRALASVPPQSMPPEVVARLDARLEGLRAERAADAEPAADAERSGEPTAITGPTGDPARRNRRWPTVLVAAALMAVVGIGVGSVLDDFTGAGGMDAMTADRAGGAAEEGAAPRARESAPEELASEDGSYSAQSPVADRMVLTAGRLALDSDTLGGDVRDLASLRIPRAAADDEAHSQQNLRASTARRLSRLFGPCLLPVTGSGDQLVAVRLDGKPATLVLREPMDGTRVAQVYSCDDPSRLLARTEVDAR